MLSKIIKIVNWRIVNFLISREASLSEISRKTKTTKANTFHSLRELEALDMVRKTISGKTHVYKFNFLHPQAKHILEMATEEKRMMYSRKLKNLPIVLHSFLSAALKTNYKGCIFFGSSVAGSKYNDIDVFIALKDRENAKEIEKRVKLMDKRISPIFGSERELEAGAEKQDMLYKNILEGVSFGVDIVNIKYRDFFLMKADIKERFIMGYREVLSCLEFTERGYQKTHLERGAMDFIYAVLNYFGAFPKNGMEAVALFKKKLRESKPKTIKSALGLMEKYAWIL